MPVRQLLVFDPKAEYMDDDAMSHYFGLELTSPQVTAQVRAMQKQNVDLTTQLAKRNDL